MILERVCECGHPPEAHRQHYSKNTACTLYTCRCLRWRGKWKLNLPWRR